MKKTFLFVLTIVFAIALLGIGGCGQSQSQRQGQGTSQSHSFSQGEGKSQVNGTRVSFIDVGKGDCVLLQSGASAALIDAGYSDTADKVLSYLSACGVKTLDFLIITHYDKDHIGGVGAIGEELAIGTVYLPGYEGSDKHYLALMAEIERLGLSTQRVTQEFSLELGDAVIDVFPSGVTYVPGVDGDEGNDNDMSIVASLASGNDSYLFAGDLEKEGLAAYLDERHGRFDVLKVPHHGRKCALTDEFLEDVQPKIAVITDSIDDPADKKTLKLLDEIGADIYRTSDSGTIAVQSDGTGNYSVSFN